MGKLFINISHLRASSICTGLWGLKTIDDVGRNTYFSYSSEEGFMLDSVVGLRLINDAIIPGCFWVLWDMNVA